MVKMAKYGHFEYVVEYPIWVSIKRYWMGKLAQACHNWIYSIGLTLTSMGSENNKKGWGGAKLPPLRKMHFGVSELPQNVHGGVYTHTNLKSRRTDL